MQVFNGEKWLFFFNLLLSRWVNAGKNTEQYQPQNILCIKWDEIGDVAACTHVFELLKTKFPAAKIHVITKPYAADLLQNNPFVDQVSTSLSAWNQRYDLHVELRGTWKTLLKTFRFYPRIRLDRGTVRFRQRGNQPHETLTNYRIIEPVLGGIKNTDPKLFPDDKNQEKVQQFLTENNLKKFCIFHAGARRELRRWPDENFAALADWLCEEKGLQAVFVGTEPEEPQIENIIKKMGNPAVLCTRNFGLPDLAALCKQASLYVGNESGPLQIADIMQTPLLGLFGPGVKDVFYPRNPNARIIHHVLSCNPCDQIHCVNPGNTCMQRITLAEAKMAVNAIIS